MPESSLVDEIAAFVSEMLPANAETWCKHYKRRAKILHDSLWGTFRIHAHEMALLDTPLLQRLRFIRQTGAVYLTYPSALHTRFEHTLGVLCQADGLCNSLRREGDEGRVNGIETNVRYAALLHDAGHGPFSHTSEEYFGAMDEITELRGQLRFRESGAGEILSFLIAVSKPMRGFISAVSAAFKVDLDAETIGKMIIGDFPDAQMYKAEIIHGPLDADKLDYMPRDGMFSGLKMHVDLDRLFYSIEILSGKTVDSVPQTRIAGSVAGISPLMQIMFNKMLLFTGMYHHHKVRTVDCMLRAAFDLAREEGATVGGVKLETPVAFLRTTDDRLLTPELSDSERIKTIIMQIRNRQLWHRALTISRRTVPVTMHDELSDTESGAFAEYVNLSGNRPDQLLRKRELADALWTKAGEPCERREVWLDMPKIPSMHEAKEMWIQSPGQKHPQTLGEFIPIEGWVNLYGMHQQRSHVFCPRDCLERVGKAAEHVLKERFGLELLPAARSYSNVEV